MLRSRAVETDAEEEVQIEGIDRNYCDDFVCTSSPQVCVDLLANSDRQECRIWICLVAPYYLFRIGV